MHSGTVLTIDATHNELPVIAIGSTHFSPVGSPQ